MEMQFAFQIKRVGETEETAVDAMNFFCMPQKVGIIEKVLSIGHIRDKDRQSFEIQISPDLLETS